MAKTWREWERPLIELEDGLAKLRQLARDADPAKKQELETMVADFERRKDNYINIMYSRLGPWEKVLVARADKRPYTLDYINAIFTDFV